MVLDQLLVGVVTARWPSRRWPWVNQSCATSEGRTWLFVVPERMSAPAPSPRRGSGHREGHVLREVLSEAAFVAW